nr:unnamed protein product [Digitaria exilis]
MAQIKHESITKSSTPTKLCSGHDERVSSTRLLHGAAGEALDPLPGFAERAHRQGSKIIQGLSPSSSDHWPREKKERLGEVSLPPLSSYYMRTASASRGRYPCCCTSLPRLPEAEEEAPAASVRAMEPLRWRMVEELRRARAKKLWRVRAEHRQRRVALAIGGGSCCRDYRICRGTGSTDGERARD